MKALEELRRHFERLQESAKVNGYGSFVSSQDKELKKTCILGKICTMVNE